MRAAGKTGKRVRHSHAVSVEGVQCSKFIHQSVRSFCRLPVLSFSFQLQEAFGWEPFIRLFTEYRNQTNLPTDNVDKMNLWVKMFSHQVQKNLAPFFEAWAWPIQKEVATSLAYLPEWKENIMKLYLLTQM